MAPVGGQVDCIFKHQRRRNVALQCQTVNYFIFISFCKYSMVFNIFYMLLCILFVLTYLCVLYVCVYLSFFSLCVKADRLFRISFCWYNAVTDVTNEA